MLQIPGEARGSRTASIILSVVVHLALFLALGRLVIRPKSEAGPTFQIFQLSAPAEQPTHIEAPVIEPPPLAEAEKEKEKKDVITPEPQPAPPREQAAAVPILSQPVDVPSTIPPATGQSLREPDGMAAPTNAPRSAAERLLRTGIGPVIAPGVSLTAPGRPPAPVTPREAAAARMASGMKAINDSIAAAEAAANAVTDWTKKDKTGNKWGVTPGQLHLGSITLPLPIYFNPPAGRREDAAKSARIYAESNAQAKRMEVEETFESRVKAMRKRKDAQRDSAKAARGGKGGN